MFKLCTYEVTPGVTKDQKNSLVLIIKLCETTLIYIILFQESY